MWKRWMPVIASAVTMALVTILGVVFLFRPIAESDSYAVPWPPAIAVLLYLVLSIALFDWTARRMQNVFAAAFVIAASQFIFIVDLLARGERGILTAAAGTALLVATWFSVALVYSKLSHAKTG